MQNKEIRAHHCLCILFFEGKGYSNDFVDNMSSFIHKLQENPNIKIVGHEDIICSKCPHSSSAHNDCEDVVFRDKALITSCNLSFGDILPLKQLKQIIDQNIIRTQKYKDICKNCRWNYICFKKIDKSLV